MVTYFKSKFGWFYSVEFRGKGKAIGGPYRTKQAAIKKRKQEQSFVDKQLNMVPKF